MGLLRSLAMLSLIAVWWFSSPLLASGSSSRNARSLNALLQDYAYRAFVPRPKTGVPYNATVPSNLTGIELSALRLRSGSLFRKGVSYREFEIPRGLSVTPYVERLVLVYRNLGIWSASYYPLEGYTYLAPVLGLLAYDALNLSAKNLPELKLRATIDPVSIEFRDVEQVPGGTAAKCVWFDLDGSPSFSDVVSGNVCSTVGHGHFSIVVQSITPAPSPGHSPSPTPRGGGGKKADNTKVWIIVGSAVGGVALGAAAALLVVWGRRYQKRERMRRMERAADVGEALQMTPIGDTKAPAATVTRTQPVLESEYVP